MSAVVFEFSEKGAAAVLKALKEVGVEAERSSKKIEAARAREIKAATNAAAKIIKENKKALDQQEKDHKKFLENQEALVKKNTNFRIKEAQKAAKAMEAANKKAIESSTLNIGANIGKELGSKLSSGLKYALLGAVAAAMATVTAAVHSNLKLDELANRISITGRKPGQKFADRAEIRDQLQGAAISNPGVKSEDLGAGVMKFIQQGGSLEMGRQLIPAMATAASATGASPDEIGDALGELGSAFHIDTIEGYKDAIAELSAAAKNSDMPFNELAKQLADSDDFAGRFNLSLKDLAVLTTTAKGVKGLRGGLGKLEADQISLAQQGIHLRDKGGKPRAIRDVIFDLISKTGGTGPEIQKKQGLEKLLGKKGRFIEPFLTSYETAYQGAGGDKNATAARAAGEKALTDSLEQAYGAAGQFSEVEKDAAQAQQDTSAQLTAAWELLKSKTNDLIPQIVKLAPVVAELVPAIVPLISVFGELLRAAKSAAEAMGLLHKKGADERAKTAQQALVDFNKAHEKEPPTERSKEVQEEYTRLKKEADDAQDEANKQGKIFSDPDAVAKGFADASGAKPGTAEYADKLKAGKQFQEQIYYNPNMLISTVVPGIDEGTQGYLQEYAEYLKTHKTKKGIAKATDPFKDFQIDPNFNPYAPTVDNMKEDPNFNPYAPTVENMKDENIKPEVKAVAKVIQQGNQQRATQNAALIAAIKADAKNRTQPKD